MVQGTVMMFVGPGSYVGPEEARVTSAADGSFELQVKPDANGNITVIATDEFGNEQKKVEHVGG